MGVLESLGHDRGHELARRGRGPAYGRGGELVRQRVGGGGDELVGLVEHHRLVLGQHLRAGEDVQGEQGVIGDDDIGLLRRLPGPLAEAVDPVRALAAQALACTHRHLPPGPVGHRERYLVAVAGLAARRPLPQLEHGATEQAAGPFEQLVLLGLARPRAVMELLQADVVAATFRQRIRRATAERALERSDQARQILVDELGLQRLGRRGHDHPFATGERRHEIAERLAGARPSLDQEVLPAAQRQLDRRDHRPLPFPRLRAGDRAESNLEQRKRRTPGHPSSHLQLR